ncbi:radical SAM protein [Deltaproteobacteria bacterium TL4]
MSNLRNPSSASVLIISPHVVVHNLDVHTGIPFMPHMAAHLAGALNAHGYEVQVIDCFGYQPHFRSLKGEFMLLGVSEDWVVEHVYPDCKIAFLYCKTVEDLISIEALIKALKRHHPQIKLCVFENIQTVNSFSLKSLVPELLEIGTDVAILGEPELRCHDIAQALITGQPLNLIPGIAYWENDIIRLNKEESFNNNLDDLPFPLWEKFPLEGYWIARFAHAPVKNEKFLPILTSRGCPYKCTFCIAPTLNPRWRSRSAKNVVDEMEYFYKTLGVSDFHISDLDPTIDETRTQNICEEIIARKLPVSWKIAQGTKIETIKNTLTLEKMAQAGCKFFSFSPETGSPKLLKIMKKPFNHEHALNMVRSMNQLGIRMQACFIAGVPGEDEEDRQISIEYVKKLVIAGVDEIAVTIFTPLPGAALSDAIEGWTHHSQLTHSPTWRKDYSEIQHYRMRMYRTFFLWKLLYFPKKVVREIYGLLTGNFETKMEMSLYKYLKLRLLRWAPWIFRKLATEKMLLELKQRKRSNSIC